MDFDKLDFEAIERPVRFSLSLILNIFILLLNQLIDLMSYLGGWWGGQ